MLKIGIIKTWSMKYNVIDKSKYSMKTRKSSMNVALVF